MDQQKAKIEAIYPLSAMQQGMLFHSLYAPQSGVYFVQIANLVVGKLDVKAFKAAWQQVVARHAVLRTLFVWEQRQKPLQVVLKEVELPWTEQDWRFVEDQEQQLNSYLAAEREQGFELDRAPLMRCALMRVSDESYYFVWNFHHLLLDGWSIPLLQQEVWAFYQSACREERLPRIARPRPYKDYISWLQRQDLAQAEAYWRQALQGFTAPTPLVVDRARANDQKAYSEHQVYLSSKTSAALQKMARENRLTLNTVIQGAWALLLSRYSSEEEVLFGATVSGRPHELSGVERMVGLFINTLPVRVKVLADMPLLDWLSDLQEQQREREQYAYSPLIDVISWSEVPSGTPLFESLFVYENYPVDKESRKQGAGLQITSVRSVEQTNYPLTLIAALIESDFAASDRDASQSFRFDEGDGSQLCLMFSYDTSRFVYDIIERMAGHLQTLLASVVVNPDQPLALLPWLTKREKHQLLVEWNDTATDYPSDKCIHQLFEEQVERTPSAIALVFEDQAVTYLELNARANQLAHYLIVQGVGPDVLVGICIERSVEMVVGLLGILKAGGAYVPLDPTLPSERLAFMLSDTKVSWLLTQSKWRFDLPPTVHRYDLDVEWPLGDSSNSRQLSTPNNLAYIMYTSGSTGRPKGVCVTHQNVVRLVQNNHFASMSADEVFLQLAPISFDASTLELWAALLNGAKLVVMPPHQGGVDLSELAQTLKRHQITTLWLTAGLFHLMVDEHLEALGTLRQLLAGGDVLSVSHVKKVLQRWPDCQLINGYGPTENTTFTTCCSLRSLQIGASVPIGKPIANTQVYILDKELQPVPVGVVGQLYAGGAGVARGYLNRPKLTQERFIPNPFGPGRLYKTGDLCRYLADGNPSTGSGHRIEFVGRADYQVKIRGFRVELGEIEANLRQCVGLREAVVVVRDEASGKRLVAYVVGEVTGSTELAEVLRAALTLKLPDYMIPNAFVPLEAMPLTPNGKIDRRALPAPTSLVQVETTYVAPQNEIEREIAQVWQEMLLVDKVGVHDNFFELGGHSLLIIQLHNRLQKMYEQKLAITDLFKYPTVSALAAYLSKSVGTTSKQPDSIPKQDRAEFRHIRRAKGRQRRELRQKSRSR